MIVMEQGPEVVIQSNTQAELRVERTDISFEDLSGECVRIRVRVHNDRPVRSKRTLMKLESAPLGAFVPWRPLAELPVPPIEPGESRELTIDVKRPEPVPLGSFDRIPPQKLLAAAVGSPDEPSRPNRRFEAMAKLFQRQTPGRSTKSTTTIGLLAPDLMELLGRGNRYWAGNINVFVGARPVERHMARALRVYPGCTNLAAFVVGVGGPSDAYAFDIVGLGANWQAALYDMTNGKTLVVNSDVKPIQENKWVEAAAGMSLILALHPPADCGEGNVEVHVTKRSSQKTAIVEFNLDPDAQGSGCYFV
jgi:hypothetical protein